MSKNKKKKPIVITIKNTASATPQLIPLCGGTKQDDLLKKAQKNSEITHKIWWKFHNWLRKNWGEDWHKKLVGWEAIEKVQKYAKKNKDIKIVRCDDDLFSSSILVIVPHIGMGKSVIFIPQNTYITNRFFLYPNHERMLMEALSSVEIKSRLDIMFHQKKAETPKPVKEKRLIPAEYRHQLAILNMVMKKGGSIEFKKPICSTWDNISKIKGIFYDKQAPESADGWNKYVDDVKKAIGVKTYCVWVRDFENKEGDVVGFLACFDKHGKEVKMKRFRLWSMLKKHIENVK